MCSAILAHWRIEALNACSDSFMNNHYCFRCGFSFLWWWHNSAAWTTGLKNLVRKLGGVAVTKGCQPHDLAHSCSLPSSSNEVVFQIPPGSDIAKFLRVWYGWLQNSICICCLCTAFNLPGHWYATQLHGRCSGCAALCLNLFVSASLARWSASSLWSTPL